MDVGLVLVCLAAFRNSTFLLLDSIGEVWTAPWCGRCR